jgi:hypothetical protein
MTLLRAGAAYQDGKYSVQIGPGRIHSGSSTGFVLGKQKLHGKQAQMASLSHLLVLLSGSIRQQHGICGRTSFIWPSPLRSYWKAL